MKCGLFLLLLSFATLGSKAIKRDDFPEDFVFGSGTSAYQVEGAAAEDGRTPSIWDSFVSYGYGNGSGDVASDGYHKYKEDVKLMAEMGLAAYRFSISWSRLIPNGRGDINPKGLEFYNNLIDELVSHGIQPHVTLSHFDYPQLLQDEYGGWLNRRIVDDFTAFADVCFSKFGDRVSHWVTINEANMVGINGFGLGSVPPGRCSHPYGNCSSGNSIFEPYIVAHHVLLAHSSVVSLYRSKYQGSQRGSIGLNLIIFHFEPKSNSTADQHAGERAWDFFVDWMLEPLTHGDYPETIKKAAGFKLSKFSHDESDQLVGAFDFIGLNYYAVLDVEDCPNDLPPYQRDVMGDMSASLPGFQKKGMPSKPQTLERAASGLRAVLEKMKQRYNNPTIYIHENGLPLKHDGSFNDTNRVKHFIAHLESLHDAMRNGSDTRGYFTWSFVDVLELFQGYEASFGLYYVDFNDKERRRYPMLSSQWYSNFLKRGQNMFGKFESFSEPQSMAI
ncbi:hypothetical protein HPP92_021997 [Vanilla planifolia]|uniref:Beta-glucosidase n=1 Tax=Vanilla planifolia TaxID=51239 RepID=A0A835PSJ5_VANPL|nr:hypothetical protein HPP92_022311 [Vanilla planifolia]KAG0458869.1 hypothetical protein HPP92_021997 [Vanilla planifolia]